MLDRDKCRVKKSQSQNWYPGESKSALLQVLDLLYMKKF